MKYLKLFNENLSDKFKNWFYGSKVVDKEGNPLIVYHGTGAKFSKFSSKKSTDGIIWFTTNKEAIERGEVGAEGTGYIKKLYVSLKNPAGWDEYEKYYLQELVNMGYDGAILPNNDGSYDGFVFNTNQIRIVNK
jgi:hypothetical protein